MAKRKQDIQDDLIEEPKDNPAPPEETLEDLVRQLFVKNERGYEIQFIGAKFKWQSWRYNDEVSQLLLKIANLVD